MHLELQRGLHSIWFKIQIQKVYVGNSLKRKCDWSQKVFGQRIKYYRNLLHTKFIEPQFRFSSKLKFIASKYTLFPFEIKLLLDNDFCFFLTWYKQKTTATKLFNCHKDSPEVTIAFNSYPELFAYTAPVVSLRICVEQLEKFNGEKQSIRTEYSLHPPSKPESFLPFQNWRHSMTQKLFRLQSTFPSLFSACKNLNFNAAFNRTTSTSSVDFVNHTNNDFVQIFTRQWLFSVLHTKSIANR